MNFKFENVTCSGLLAVIPKQERSFLDDMTNFNFSEKKSLKLKEVMGYDKHRLVEEGVCVSDLAVFGLKKLFDNGFLRPEEIDAIILVTQSPDYFIPSTSSVIQGELALKKDMFCLDINQGCAGYIVGLIQAFMMLSQECIKKVVLINADILSRKVSIHDRNSYPLIGDALSISIINRGNNGKVFANLKMDGKQRNALMIPAGGFRLPTSQATSVLEVDADNNSRALDHLRMDGSAVFNFVQTEVPKMINELMQASGIDISNIERFAFHQPNRFMLEKLADKIGVSRELIPSNIVEKFGNSSGVTIPLVIAYNLRAEVIKRSMLLCLAGFGVGLTWGSIAMKFGKLDFCELVEF